MRWDHHAVGRRPPRQALRSPGLFCTPASHARAQGQTAMSPALANQGHVGRFYTNMRIQENPYSWVCGLRASDLQGDEIW